jgi:hypothetical protein
MSRIAHLFQGELDVRRITQTVAFSLLVLCSSAVAQSVKKSCDDLKSEIAAKLDAKGVKNYTLDIVAADEVKDQTVVGSCEGGTKKIVYKRN